MQQQEIFANSRPEIETQNYAPTVADDDQAAEQQKQRVALKQALVESKDQDIADEESQHKQADVRKVIR